MNNPFADLLFAAQSLLGIAQPKIVAPPTLPDLSGSVALSDLIAGLEAAKAFNWSAVQTVLNEKFSNIQDDLVLVEDVAQAIAPFFLPAVYAEDAAAILLVITKLV